jgi:hypothetical protein
MDIEKYGKGSGFGSTEGPAERGRVDTRHLEKPAERKDVGKGEAEKKDEKGDAQS